MTKPEIREIARELGLRVADKVDSQEICFVPGSDYKEFLRSHLGESQFHRGGIYGMDGAYPRASTMALRLFTIGQRKGLPGGAHALFTSSTSIRKRRVIVGGEEDLFATNSKSIG